MLKNHKFKILGVTVLIVAAILVIFSAFSPPVPVTVSSNDNAIIPVTGGEQSLAQYYHSERGMYAAPVQYGLEIYHQSEHMQAVNWKSSSDPLYLYHQSERFGK